MASFAGTLLPRYTAFPSLTLNWTQAPNPLGMLIQLWTIATPFFSINFHRACCNATHFCILLLVAHA
jgi:hypothetical protein